MAKEVLQKLLSDLCWFIGHDPGFPGLSLGRMFEEAGNSHRASELP